MPKSIKALAFMIFASLLVAHAPAHVSASEKCKGQELVEAGKVSGEGSSVGFIVGVRWGSGTVEMNDGRTFNFKAKGAKPAEIGAAHSTFSGTVYNLKNPADFAGLYGGYTGGVTLVKGKGFAAFQNGNCVVIHVKRDEAEGIQGSVPLVTGILVELAE